MGEPPPGSKSRGRWVSGLKAECDFRGYLEKLGHGATGWNGAVFAVLASGGASWCGIFSCCNRCCTLHIVYNVPWIDVDGGEASLSHINVWPSTHTGSVRILDAVRSAVRPVYPGRGLYGLVPIILGWSAILLAQPFGCRVRFPRFALGFMGVAACEIDGIARISPLEHVGDKRLPALIRWLMTEGEARPNGCIYTYTFLAVGGKAHSTMPNVLTTWTLTKSGLECWQSGLMQLSRKQSHCEVPEVRILHIPRWGSSTTPEGKCLPLVLACLVMKAADASVNGDSVDGHASWV